MLTHTRASPYQCSMRWFATFLTFGCFGAFANFQGAYDPTECGGKYSDSRAPRELYAYAHWAHGNLPNSGGNSHHAHGHYSVGLLYRIQICQFAALKAWSKLAEQHNITRWAAQSGSLVGCECYQGLNPWDDDIDITVSRRHTHTMGRLWTNAEITTDFERSEWSQRYLLNRSFLLYRRVTLGINSKARNGINRRQEWFKLVPTAQAMAFPTKDVSGIDITLEYITEYERACQKASGYTRYINSDRPLQSVAFGPTRINQMPKRIVDAYFKQKRWNCLAPSRPLTIVEPANVNCSSFVHPFDCRLEPTCKNVPRDRPVKGRKLKPPFVCAKKKFVQKRNQQMQPLGQRAHYT